jgi:hypothetical protein
VGVLAEAFSMTLNACPSTSRCWNVPAWCTAALKDSWVSADWSALQFAPEFLHGRARWPGRGSPNTTTHPCSSRRH